MFVLVHLPIKFPDPAPGTNTHIGKLYSFQAGLNSSSLPTQQHSPLSVDMDVEIEAMIDKLPWNAFCPKSCSNGKLDFTSVNNHRWDVKRSIRERSENVDQAQRHGHGHGHELGYAIGVNDGVKGRLDSCCHRTGLMSSILRSEGEFTVEEDDNELSLLEDLHQEIISRSVSDGSVPSDRLTCNSVRSSWSVPFVHDPNGFPDPPSYCFEEKGDLLSYSNHNYEDHVDGHDTNINDKVGFRDFAGSDAVWVNRSSTHCAERDGHGFSPEDQIMSFVTSDLDVTEFHDPFPSEQNTSLTPLQLYSFLPVNASAYETVTHYSLLEPENTTILDLLELHSPSKGHPVCSRIHPSSYQPARWHCGIDFPHSKDSPSAPSVTIDAVLSTVTSSLTISPMADRKLHPNPLLRDRDFVKTDDYRWNERESNPCWLDKLEAGRLKQAVASGDDYSAGLKNSHGPQRQEQQQYGMHFPPRIDTTFSIRANHDSTDGRNNRYEYGRSDFAAFERSLVSSLIGGFQPIPVNLKSDFHLDSTQAPFCLSGSRIKRSTLTDTSSSFFPWRECSSSSVWQHQLTERGRERQQQNTNPLSAFSWDLLWSFEKDVYTALDVYQLLLSSFSPTCYSTSVAFAPHHLGPAVIDNYQGGRLDDMIKSLNATRVLVIKVISRFISSLYFSPTHTLSPLSCVGNFISHFLSL